MTYTFQGLIFSHEEIKKKKSEVHNIINVKNWRIFSESISNWHSHQNSFSIL